MEEIENGIRIKHEYMGREQVVEVTYTDGRVNLKIADETFGSQQCYLDMGESGYFLAFMATWYEQGGD